MIKFYSKLPESPGVYLMKDAAGRVLYVGKAANLRRRVASYFIRANDARIESLVGRIKKIDFKKTDSALEALIMEAELIKKLQPPFNVREKDDKSFLYVEITKENFPRVLLVRGRKTRNDAELNAERRGRKTWRKSAAKRYGPFTFASNIREALKILRRIFPWSTHKHNANDAKAAMRMMRKNHSGRACLDYELGLCPGTCTGAITRKDYLENIKKLRMFFAGRRKELLRSMEKEMKAASKNLEFERAEGFRRQLFALKHIRDTALISDSRFQIPDSKFRIEGYDISNISGTYAVGSMAVFTGGEPAKSEYRKFRIRTVRQSDDVSMLKEVLRRRFAHEEWLMSDLILVDGGRGQVSAAKAALDEFGIRIPVVGIAKGPQRKRNEFVASESAYRTRPPELSKNEFKKLLIRVRDEAHRFAVRYHRAVRRAGFIAR